MIITVLSEVKKTRALENANLDLYFMAHYNPIQLAENQCKNYAYLHSGLTGHSHFCLLQLFHCADKN